MGKDPACLWYWNDWIGGTFTLSRAIKGAYMDLLAAQFNNGHLSLDEIKTVLGSDFGSMWPTLQKKFVKDDNGLYYNNKLREESIKRAEFAKSRRKNALTEKHMHEHMENENADGFLLDLEKRKSEFVEKVNCFIYYPEIMRKEFISYWTERSEKGRKMRFEMEKVFDMSRRLSTWESKSKNYANNQKNGNGSIVSTFK